MAVDNPDRIKLEAWAEEQLKQERTANKDRAIDHEQRFQIATLPTFRMMLRAHLSKETKWL